MVTRYGMSDLMGPMVYGENEGEVFLGRSITRTVNMSEETMRKVDGEIRKIIDQQYAVARKLLEDNRDKVEAMAAALLELETIDADQIDDIMSGLPPRPPKPPQIGQRASATTGRRASAPGTRRPATRRCVRETVRWRDRAAARCRCASRRCFRCGALSSFDLSRPLRDGHPERHARFVFRRRTLSSTATHALRTRGRCAPTAPI